MARPGTSRAREGAAQLSRIGWLARIPQDFRAAILQAILWYEAAPGEVFIREEDDVGGLFAIADGVAELAFRNAHPDARVLHLAHAGFWAGPRPLLGRPRSLTMTARTPLLWALVPEPQIRRLLAARPGWWEHIAQLGEDASEQLFQALSDASRKSSAKRVAALLLRLAGCRLGRDQGDGPYEVLLAQDEIADMAAMSRSTLRKALETFSSEGWLDARYVRIRLLEPDRLRQFLDQEAD